MVWSALRGLPTTPTVSGGHEQALASLLVLLLGRMIGGAFAGVLVLLRFASGVVENCSDRLLARCVADGDVEQLLGGPRALVA